MEKTPAHLEIILQFFADFSPAQLQQLIALDTAYREWNEKINVISRKDIDGLYEKHVLHSLAIAAAFDFTPGMEVIDIGTGGGFPGIPLAIFFPATSFHLVDSIGKKIKVVEAVKEAVGLQNITTEKVRAEEIKNRKFDVAVSRAVAPLKELWTWSRPLLRKPRKPANPNPIGINPTPTNPDADPGSFLSDLVSSPPSANDIAALPSPSGLICLKGGDLTAEIAESSCRPKIMEITEIFDLDYFKEKYLLHIPF
jgi:16S rRNA (guanine527-N7)-methyltransferase